MTQRDAVQMSLENELLFLHRTRFSASKVTAVHKVLFYLIIIDEATQATEPDVVVPLTLYSPDVHAVQIGNHKQLPATAKPQA